MSGSTAPDSLVAAGGSSFRTYRRGSPAPDSSPENSRIISRSRSLSRSSLSVKKLAGAFARRTLGLILLLITVLLWTGSNFLASVSLHSRASVFKKKMLMCYLQTIFADDSFSKPFLVTYLNMSFFTLSLPIIFVRRLWVARGSITKVTRKEDSAGRSAIVNEDEHEAFLKPDVDNQPTAGKS